MIVAVAGQHGGAGKAIIASQLALLRARSGRRVLLLDTDPRHAACTCCGDLAADLPARFAARPFSGRALVGELQLLRSRYNDIVIDTEGRDSADSRTALIAARLALVPVTPQQADLASQYQLIARLNFARMFNPGLRVLFVLVGGAAAPSDEERAAVRAYAARVMSATLASTTIRGAAAADMAALYREVFNH